VAALVDTNVLDVLIALTARRHGATVVTANRRDFSLLRSRLKIGVLYA
jgi:predicted nucleic acid-binding protein